MGHTIRFGILALFLLIIGTVTAVLSYGGSDDRDSRVLTSDRVPSAADGRIASLQQTIAAGTPGTGLYSELGSLYLQKARETADPGYYARADESFQQVLSGSPNDPQALIGAASVALARHDFAQALVLAEKAKTANPYDPDTYGAVFDALVELGRYDEAVDALQRMADLRPDLNSYARISYARELHGDLDGAKEAMRLAVDAAGPRGETAAWVRLQLGHLYFLTGDLDAAEMWYEGSLQAAPGYVHGLAALGRAAAAHGDLDEAAGLYAKATERLPVLEYVVALGDVYKADGKEQEAARQYELVGAIDILLKSSGVKTDLELALFYTDHGNPAKAVELAVAAYADRPSVQAADVLAWALHKTGRTDEAAMHAREALRMGWTDNNALFHAAIIEADAGHEGLARQYLEQIASRKPGFSPLYASQAAEKLAELEDLARN